MSVDSLESVDIFEGPFNGVTNYDRVWRQGAGKRGLECGCCGHFLRKALEWSWEHSRVVLGKKVVCTCEMECRR